LEKIWKGYHTRQLVDIGGPQNKEGVGEVIDFHARR